MQLQRASTMPGCAPVAYKFSSTVKTTTVYQGITWTGLIYSRDAFASDCWRLPIRALFKRLPAAIASARTRCRRSSNQPMLMAPAEAWVCREARRTRQSPKAKTEAVKDPPELESSQKCSLRNKACVETRSTNRSPKCASSSWQEMLVKVGI